jgi:hypothetical protein
MRGFSNQASGGHALPPPLPANGSLRVGSYTLEAGAPGGSFAHFEPKGESENADALRAALTARPDEAGLAVIAVEKLQKSTAAVTGRIEQASRLSQAAREGRLFEVESLSGEIDAFLSLAERLDRAGRLKEELRLLRAMHGLLVLSLRWLDLIRALRRALSTARVAGDRAAEAWALHELGTLQLAAGDATGAAERLNDALRLKETLGDASGRCVTRHNFDSARRDVVGGGAPPGGGSRLSLRFAGAVMAVALVAFFVGAAGPGFAPWGDTTDDTAIAGPPHDTTTADPANHAPHAGEDLRRMREDGELVVSADVLIENDRDADGDRLAVTTVEPIAGRTHGSVSLADGAVVYRPNRDVNGPASFRYTVSDGNGGAATSLVSVTVEPVNDLPEARADTLATSAGVAGSVDVLGNDRDVDGDRLGVVRYSVGEHGRVSCSPAGLCTYFPAAGTSGPDTFTYTVEDGNGGEATGRVVVQVTALALLSVGDASVPEGTEGATAKTVFTLSLSKQADSRITVDWETRATTGEDAATAGEDFKPAKGTVVLEAGQSEATIVVEIIGDANIEFDERFEVHLHSVSGAELGDSIGRGRIENDDAFEAVPIIP